MDADRTTAEADHADRCPPEEVALRLVPPPGWRPPPEARRMILRLVLAARERREAA